MWHISKETPLIHFFTELLEVDATQSNCVLLLFVYNTSNQCRNADLKYSFFLHLKKYDNSHLLNKIADNTGSKKATYRSSNINKRRLCSKSFCRQPLYSLNCNFDIERSSAKWRFTLDADNEIKKNDLWNNVTNNTITSYFTLNRGTLFFDCCRYMNHDEVM